ncbi:MAG: M1 family metallopeptidase [Crocinitomicaceae bacterium]|nr:M1 family metallopeptidase [Crocinitomicaceae bacterium]
MKKSFEFFLKISLFSFGIILNSCNDSTKDKENNKFNIHPIDCHSYSNIDHVRTIHLDLELDVDFKNKIIYGVARHTMKNKGFDTIIFDTKHLSIQKVTVGQKKEEKEIKFHLGPWDKDSILGQPLRIVTSPAYSKINIYYKTTKKSAALDWLEPNQTEGKIHPFLYTQGEPILTRTWIPLQDTPGNRFTYTAEVSVPDNLIAVMSAKKISNKNGKFKFRMNKEIPSYLIALAVGDLKYKKINEMCGVYAEKELIKTSTKEFEDLPKMIDAAEVLYGKYKWEQYDILVLPYAFPFGGMENPMLAFINPTVITGDKSLVSVIAHELAHSWSGNLVTNRTWNDFWLNEGVTVYIEHRIMEEIRGKGYSDMLSLIEFSELKNEVIELKKANRIYDTRLKLDLKGRDPDDCITQIAYVKGAYFFKTLEKLVGRKSLDEFLLNYFKDYSFKSISTEKFILYLKKNLLLPKHLDFNVEEWIYKENIPLNCIQINSTKFKKMKRLAKQFISGRNIFRKKGVFEKSKKTGQSKLVTKQIKRTDFSTQEWMEFIRSLPNDIDVSKLSLADKYMNFSTCGNAEIMMEWYLLCIKRNYKEVFPQIEKFLKKIGRRKYLSPIYKELIKSNKEWAKQIFNTNKENYHSISRSSIQKILN